jgi:Family of unknown function (DUF6111)
MMRVVIENIVLFLMPAAAYVAYVWLTRERTGTTAGVLDGTPFGWLFAAGAVLVVATLVIFGDTSGGRPGDAYEPPSMKDGHITPGRVR